MENVAYNHENTLSKFQNEMLIFNEVISSVRSPSVFRLVSTCLLYTSRCV